MARQGVIMLAYLTTAAGIEYKPGDPAPRPGDESLDVAELDRLVEIGGARDVTEVDMKALAALQASLGPTVEEYVAAGYLAKNYPPAGYDSRSSAEQIAAAAAAQLASVKAMKVDDLKAFATQHGIAFAADAKKEDLQTAVEAALSPAA